MLRIIHVMFLLVAGSARFFVDETWSSIRVKNRDMAITPKYQEVCALYRVINSARRANRTSCIM
jgi:hypothetical protein